MTSKKMVRSTALDIASSFKVSDSNSISQWMETTYRWPGGLVGWSLFAGFQVGTSEYKRLVFKVPEGLLISDNKVIDDITWHTWTRYMVALNFDRD